MNQVLNRRGDAFLTPTKLGKCASADKVRLCKLSSSSFLLLQIHFYI